MKDEEIGTLAELGVKAGDVVELVSWSDGDDMKVGMHYTVMDKHPNGRVNTMVAYNGTSYFTVDGNQCGYVVKFRIISRADNTPKTWGEMADAEKGALLLAEHEGKAIEISDGDRWLEFDKSSKPNFQRMSRYRIKPEPKRETVVLYGRPGLQWVWDKSPYDTHRITFDTTDGEPDCSSIKMEKL